MASLTPAKHAANVQMKDNLFKDKPPVIELITNKRKVAACLPIENTSVDSQCQAPTQMVYTHTHRASSFTMQKQATTLSCGFTSSRLQLTGLVDLQSSRNGACSLWYLLCVCVHCLVLTIACPAVETAPKRQVARAYWTRWHESRSWSVCTRSNRRGSQPLRRRLRQRSRTLSWCSSVPKR